MNAIGIPCNQCVNQHHTTCTGDKLEKNGYIRSGKDHCSCSRDGHPGNDNPREQPKIKGMFTKKKEDDDVVKEKEVVVEE